MTLSTVAEQQFYNIYRVKLRAAIAKNPTEYAFPILNADDVACKMTIALKNGTANKDSAAIRATCKQLGIPYTYAGLKAYFVSQ